MCGIAGYLGGGSAERLIAANRRLAHRGPDGEGVWFDREEGVGLAHRRLAIIDLSATGAQPMCSADGNVVLTYNGEIYNYRELRADLLAGGKSLRGHSDTEVLLELFCRDGEAVIERLNGIFAFALWDRRSRSLLLARDAFGVKPLYYVESAAGFAFASELKAILCLDPEARALDIASLHRYLTFLWCPGDGTLLRHVHKVAPGEALWVQGGRIVRRWTWYRLPPFRSVRPDLTVRQAVPGTAEHLRRAVRRQLVADVPVGAFLSGGLDSSAVVAFAREQVADLRCFTIDTAGGAEAGSTDDLPYARRVAQHLRVPLDVVRVDPQAIAADFADMIVQLDEPLADPAPLNVQYICRLARANGIKVLLSGAGGDDVFTGYRRHVAVHYQRLWRWLPRGARAALERLTLSLDQRNAWSRRAAKLFSGATLGADRHLAAYFNWGRQEDLLQLYTPEVRAQLGDAAADTPMLEFLRPLPVDLAALERMLVLEQRFFLADHNLAYTDRMSMACGVEVRVPFLDPELVEYAAHIPLGLKQRGREGKWVLKKALEPYLPREVIHRPKTGFGAPLRRWLTRELRPLLEDLLAPASLRRRGLFAPEAVRQLIDQNERGQRDATYVLLSLMSVESWCRGYLDVAAAPDALEALA
jgi:asparagine synthase (glutamine-hydrolysing)